MAAAVRLGWPAALKSPNDSRVLRVIFPWPNRRAVEAEAAEFGVDPLLLVAIVRQESVFDAQALSPAGESACASNTLSWRTMATRSEEHTSELQSRSDLVCRLLLGKKKR